MTMEWGPRRGRRRNKQWTTVTHGVQRPLAQPPGPHGDLPSWQLVLPPSGAFTHLTAARAHRWWLPPLPVDVPVFAVQSTADPRPRRRGLRVSRHPRPVATTIVDGLRLTAPAETLLACARDLGVVDLVVLLDAALHLGSCTTEEVAAVASTGRRAGSPRLRSALALADARSESAWETLLRLLHRAGRLPVVPQHEVFDGSGVFVARGDLWLPGTRVLHEYDGADHLARPRQRQDLRRGRRLSNEGWVRRGYTSYEVLRDPATVLRDAALSLGRPAEPGTSEGVRRWRVLLASSLFTAEGTARLRRKWGMVTD